MRKKTRPSTAEAERTEGTLYVRIGLAVLLQVTAATAGGTGSDLSIRLQEITEAQASIQTLSATFTQRRTIFLFEEVLVSRGRFYFKRPEKIRWEVLAPERLDLLLTPDGIFATLGSETERTAASLPFSTREITGLLSGSIAAAGRYFEIRWPPGKEDGGYEFQLTPRSARLGRIIRQVTLELSPAGKYPHRIVLDEATGDRTEIAFENVEVNADISDATFEHSNKASID